MDIDGSDSKGTISSRELVLLYHYYYSGTGSRHRLAET